MRLSKLYVPTLKQVNTDSEYLSQEHFYKAAMLKKIYHGGFTYLPYGNQVKNKYISSIKNIFEDECINEIQMPIILRNEVKKSRQNVIELSLFEIDKDKKFFIGPIQEETVINQIKGGLTSYKKLPLTLYSKENQILNNIKLKESIISSLGQETLKFYCFAQTKENLNNQLDLLGNKFNKLLKSYGILNWIESDGGGYEFCESQKLVIDIQNGENNYFKCSQCDYKSDKKNAKPGIIIKNDVELMEDLEEIKTPNIKTIEELELFLNIEGSKFVKSLIYKVKEEYIMVEIPGDQELDEYKLARYLKVSQKDIALAESEKVIEITGAEVGFAGPLDLKIEVKTIIDKSITQMRNFIVGANKTDYHIKNVNYNRDYEAEIADDLLEMNEKSLCPNCKGFVEIVEDIEIAIKKQYDENYANEMDLKYLDENGKNKMMHFGTFEIFIESSLQALFEKSLGKEKFVIPLIAMPYDLHLIVVNPKQEEQFKLAEHLYEELKLLGIKVLYDDRIERVGAKFKDAELMGLPYCITVGRGAKDGIVEWTDVLKEIKEDISSGSVLNLITNLDRA